MRFLFYNKIKSSTILWNTKLEAFFYFNFVRSPWYIDYIVLSDTSLDHFLNGNSQFDLKIENIDEKYKDTQGISLNGTLIWSYYEIFYQSITNILKEEFLLTYNF